MIGSRIAQYTKKVSRLFSDEGLTKKASLNALASSLDYFAQLVVGFIITPLMVAGLGTYFFGVWQIMNRIFSYLSTTSGSTSALKFTLANEQYQENYDEKRRYVGSSIVIWSLLLPITGMIGAVITWYAPYWLKAPIEYYAQIRALAGISVVAVALYSILYIPQAVLQGQNQGYRRIGLSVAVFLFNGGLYWLALYLNTGIVGLGVSAVLQTVVTGIFYFSVCRTYIPWFGSKRPSLPLVKRFLKLSGWFLAWDVVVNMTVASDVVVLGVFKSVEAVPTYTLTKYIPETAITIIAIIVVGIIPGLGGIIGMGDLKRATQVRGEIFSLTWLVITVMGTSILLWNRVFLNLWVGSGHYAGAISNLLIIIVITQYVLIRTDGFIIDLTLNIRRKVVFGFVSACISIIIGGILVKYFNLGIIGICLGLIVGRLMLSVAYPLNVSHFLKISFPTQLKGIIRPAIVTTLLFSAACVVDYFLASHELLGLSGWLVLILGAASSALAVLLITFFIGLKQDQRNNIISRLRMVLSV